MHPEVVAAPAGRRPRSASTGQQIVSIGEWWLNANSPPGRSSRATSGTVRYGSANVIAPWSQNTMSKLGVRERHRLGAGMDERELDAGLGHQPASVLELAFRQVEPDRAGAEPGQRDRPLRGAATEFEDVATDDVAEDASSDSGICVVPQASPPRAANSSPCSAWYSSL